MEHSRSLEAWRNNSSKTAYREFLQGTPFALELLDKSKQFELRSTIIKAATGPRSWVPTSATQTILSRQSGCDSPTQLIKNHQGKTDSISLENARPDDLK